MEFRSVKHELDGLVDQFRIEADDLERGLTDWASFGEKKVSLMEKMKKAQLSKYMSQANKLVQATKVDPSK